MTRHPCYVSISLKYFSPHNIDRTRGAFLFHLRLKNFLKPSHIGNMARRLKKSKIRGNFFIIKKNLSIRVIWHTGAFCLTNWEKFFERQIWQAMQVARQIALSTKVASRAYSAPFAKNPPQCSGFSGLLRLPPQSPNTQNSSAATPRSGADVRKIFSIKCRNKESEKQKWRICILKRKKQNQNSFLLRFCW